MTKSAIGGGDKQYPKWHSTVAGAAAGAGARLVSAPFDLLKIRLQLTKQYSDTHIWQSFRQIVKEEGGPRALFKGNVAATYLWIGYAAVQFTLYAKITNFLDDFASTCGNHHVDASVVPSSLMMNMSGIAAHTLATNPALVAFISGATAGICATLCTYPFDICRTTFAAQNANLAANTGMYIHKSILSYAQHTLRTQGLRGFFVGMGPALVQIVPYMGINFAVYDYIIRKQAETGNKMFAGSGAAGAVAGGSSKLLVYPLDTIKKRMQAQSFAQLPNVGSNTPIKYRGMLDCIKTICRDEGTSKLYKGLSPTVIKNMVSTSFTFTCYSFVKGVLENIHDGTNNGDTPYL